ncbi:MAG: DUF2680 domain-containing protein, partial [Clostridiales bacterium]|nr:DUF2680 domain-containing protein [Clostridiales bacterium]
MTKRKVMVMIGILVLVISAGSIMVFAAAYNSPAEVLAAVTGKTVDKVVAERRETGKTYGTMAKDAGSLEEFRKEMLEMKKAVLQDRVKDGTITQGKADEILSRIEENQLNCDGSGCMMDGERMGMGFGRMGMGGRLNGGQFNG